MLVHDAGVDIGESDIGIIEIVQVFHMDRLLKLILEALLHCLEGVIHLFCRFVVDALAEIEEINNI